MSQVTITVSGAVGIGKTALCAEIEVLLKSLGLEVEWAAGESERNLISNLRDELNSYKPSVKIVEQVKKPIPVDDDAEVEGAEILCPNGEKWNPNPEGIVNGQASGPRIDSETGMWENVPEQDVESKINTAVDVALRETWKMIDPLKPPVPGTYWMGEHNGIIAALRTFRDNFQRAKDKLNVVTHPNAISVIGELLFALTERQKGNVIRSEDRYIDNARSVLDDNLVANLKEADQDSNDPIQLWAEIHTLRAALQGPNGFATWREAAVAERLNRAASDRELESLREAMQGLKARLEAAESRVIQNPSKPTGDMIRNIIREVGGFGTNHDDAPTAYVLAGWNAARITGTPVMIQGRFVIEPEPNFKELPTLPGARLPREKAQR
jgi:hypothetical protein